ncbi:DUF1304 domain-containing protein [Nostoc sp. UHCC 0702]|nr:DUF1304 domain-containing protein [Nostoc sp. UHCC 0702]
MKLLADIAVCIAGIVQIAIMILEIFFWQSHTSLRAFKMSPELAAMTTYMGANQGLYNGFLGFGIFFGLILGDFSIKVFFLSCLIIAAIFGAMTVNRLIIVFQGVPALLAFLLNFLVK